MKRKKKIRDYFKSLKFRLLLVLLLFGLVPMFVMQFFVIRGYEKRAINVRMVDILHSRRSCPTKLPHMDIWKTILMM